MAENDLGNSGQDQPSGEFDRRRLARLLTLIECGQTPPEFAAVPRALPSESPSGEQTAGNYTQRRPIVVGITGSGGAGKSTLVGQFVGHLRSSGHRVAVLACDPQSPRSGGALLGDRIRVELDPADDGVYFRSFSTRGASGGIADTIAAAVRVVASFGFDVVLVESVGIGQDQVAIRDVVDRLILLVTPAGGDEVQWEKAGLIELADIVAVNKSDLPGADRVVTALTSALSLSPSQTPPPIVKLQATIGEGVAELWALVRPQQEPGP